MLEPTGHHVLIEPDKVDEKTKGGIYLPETARKQEQNATVTGVIIAVGKQAWMGFGDSEPWAAVGDRVYFAKYGGVVITNEGKDYRLVNDEDVVAIIKEDTQ